MGNKRQPDNLKLVKGTLRKSRVNKNQPKTKVVKKAEPPEFLSLNEIALAEWNRVSPELEACKVLTSVDLSTLAAYCVSYAQIVDATTQLENEGLTYETMTKEGTVIRKHPAVDVRNIAIRLMISAATELGMTPSSRGKVSTIGPVEVQSPWAD